MDYSSTYRKIQIKYPSGRWITIRRHPTEHEINTLKYSAHKMVDCSELTTHNDLEIKIFNVAKEDFVTVISGGNWDFKEKSPSGTVIDVKVKQADDELKKDINELIRELCKMYLRPCICYPGAYSTRAKIDYFLHTEDEGNQFANAFIKQIIQRVKTYDAGKKIEINNIYPLAVNGEYVFPPPKTTNPISEGENPNNEKTDFEKTLESAQKQMEEHFKNHPPELMDSLYRCPNCSEMVNKEHIIKKLCKNSFDEKEQNPDDKNPTNEKLPFWMRLLKK